jgi:FtsH-binding integral membrane protein
MSRFQGYLCTIVGCLVAFGSFSLLPYLIITFPQRGTYALTGLQLLSARSPAAIFDQSGAFNQIQLSWFQPALIALLLLITVFQVLLNVNKQRNPMAAQRGALFVLIVASFALILLLCRTFSDMQNMILLVPHTGTPVPNPPQIANNALYNLGFLGFLVGIALAVVGSAIALRAQE